MDLQDNITVVRSPVTDLKAIKNDVEVEGLFPFFTVIIHRTDSINMLYPQASDSRISATALHSFGTLRG